MSGRRVLAAAALAVALPALAYVPNVSAILRRAAERRAALNLSALEAFGTLEVQGEAGTRLAEAMGLPPSSDGRLAIPARFAMKMPGRCRLELTRPGLAAADRPYVVVRDARLTGRVLDGVPAAVALARSACALLAHRGGPDADRSWAAALARRGVPLESSSLGRFEGRVALVVGHPAAPAAAGASPDPKPAAYFDKETLQPLRLVAAEGGAVLDTRLLGWGSAEGGDWFPKAVEVWAGEELRARFATQKATANPKLPDAAF
ncbi:MAG TPA: hypothetical protein VD838_10660 [Anaeromyxobacteraceae bacterium]|nr:hypothetical protein [Anaeromyxobacteraceae bacterium]